MLWKENDHPRDKDGKFTDKSGTNKEQKTEKVKATKKPETKNTKPVNIFNKQSVVSVDLKSAGGDQKHIKRHGVIKKDFEREDEDIDVSVEDEEIEDEKEVKAVEYNVQGRPTKDSAGRKIYFNQNSDTTIKKYMKKPVDKSVDIKQQPVKPKSVVKPGGNTSKSPASSSKSSMKTKSAGGFKGASKYFNNFK